MCIDLGRLRDEIDAQFSDPADQDETVEDREYPDDQKCAAAEEHEIQFFLLFPVHSYSSLNFLRIISAVRLIMNVSMNSSNPTANSAL